MGKFLQQGASTKNFHIIMGNFEIKIAYEYSIWLNITHGKILTCEKYMWETQHVGISINNNLSKFE